jgi:hypothetical protein
MRNLVSAPQDGAEPIDTTRRGLLRTGLFGALLLGGAGTAATLSGCSGAPPSPAGGFRYLRDGDVALMSAIIPGVLGDLLPAAGPQREAQLRDLLLRIDQSGYRLGPPAQKALAQLFDLLNLAPTRRLLAGIGPWPQATPQEVQAFLERWRLSSFGLLNAGYRALIKLVSGTYYGTHAGWAAANYPGPPPGPFQVFNS